MYICDICSLLDELLVRILTYLSSKELMGVARWAVILSFTQGFTVILAQSLTLILTRSMTVKTKFTLLAVFLDFSKTVHPKEPD